MRALDELDLRDQLGLDPADVAFAHARRLRDGSKDGVLVSSGRSRRRRRSISFSREPGADAADVPELPLLVVLAEQERAERARTPALALRVPADDELVVPVRLDLDPVVGASPRLVRRTGSLREDPLEALFLGGAEQSLAVVEQLRDLHGARALVEQLREPLPARRQCLLEQRLAFHLEHVERDEDVARAGQPLLHRRERRAAVLVQRADLAVEHRVRRAHRFPDRLGDVREPLRQVVAPPADEPDVTARHVRERPVAVPLDLVQPPVALRNLLRERREHRRVAHRSLGRRDRRRLLLALAQDQPVLLVAAELRRHERPDTVQLLPVQAHGQPAAPLLLEQLVRARVPDLDGARAVVPLRDLALERRVLERVVLDVDREVLLAGLERNAFRHGPARERAVQLEAEVVVEPRRVVSLDDEDRLSRGCRPPRASNGSGVCEGLRLRRYSPRVTAPF